MKVDGRRVAAFLRDPGDVRVVLLYGEDEGLVRVRAGVLTTLVAGAADDPFRVSWLAREDHGRLEEEASAISMLGGRRVVRVRDVGDGLAAPVARTLATAGDSLVVLDADALDWLRDHLGGDFASTRGEVEKLILYAGEERRLGLDAVMATVGDQAVASLEDAVHAAVAGDVALTDRAVERAFADGLSAVGLLRGLLLHLVRLHQARARVELGAGVSEAVDAMRPPVFWKRKDGMIRAVAGWTTVRVSAAMAELRRAELACKQTGAPDGVIARRVVLGIARQGRRA